MPLCSAMYSLPKMIIKGSHKHDFRSIPSDSFVQGYLALLEVAPVEHPQRPCEIYLPYISCVGVLRRVVRRCRCLGPVSSRAQGAEPVGLVAWSHSSIWSSILRRLPSLHHFLNWSSRIAVASSGLQAAACAWPGQEQGLQTQSDETTKGKGKKGVKKAAKRKMDVKGQPQKDLGGKKDERRRKPEPDRRVQAGLVDYLKRVKLRSKTDTALKERLCNFVQRRGVHEKQSEVRCTVQICFTGYFKKSYRTKMLAIIERTSQTCDTCC